MIYLKHIEGSKLGQVESFDLERIRIGRNPDNDLRFNPDVDRAVSGYHAEILCRGEHVTIRDAQSRNGTLVNGQRINQSTPLRDGDIIQFAPTGPKVVFSLGEAASGTGTIVVDRDLVVAPAAAASAPAQAPAESTSAAGSAPPPPPSPPSSRWKKFVVPALVLLVVIVVLGVAAWWSWTVFFVALGTVVVAAAAIAGVWWWKRRRRPTAVRASAAAHAGSAAREPAGGGDANALGELRTKWAQALERLRGSKLGRQGDDALSALPWVVALGERGAGKSEFIRAGNPPASVSTVRQAVSGTRTCDWWFFDGAVVLDTPGRYSFPVDARADGREWDEFLSLLVRSRPDALNGVLVVVAADALAVRSEPSLKDEATQLRRRLDDLVRRVGVTPPLYLAVTKMDMIAGFGEFFTEVPEAHRSQAMGWVNDDLDRRESPSAVLRRALSAIAGQLDRLRLPVLEGGDGTPRIVRGRRLLFPEEFRGLSQSLRVFADALLRPNQYDETPWFRGVFFTSARTDGAPVSSLARGQGLGDLPTAQAAAAGPGFARDLFSAILPQDRELVRRTGVAQRRAARSRRVALLATGAAVVVICGVLTVSFVRNWRALARLDVSPCLSPTGTAASGGPLSGRLQRLEQCRVVAQGLVPHGFWSRATTDFWLRQAERIEPTLKQRYVETFKREIDEPLDVALDRTLAPGPGAPVVASTVLRRIAVIGKCRADGRCPDPNAPNTWPNYRALLGAADPRIQEGDPAIALLRRTHAAYVSWVAEPRMLDDMRARDVARVAKWLSGGGLRTEWILASASSQFPPVRSRDFWGWDGPLQVDASFTRRAWAEGIQPLLQGLRTIAPDARDVQDALGRFEGDYRVEAFRQWSHFLVNFTGEERVLGGRRGARDLAVRGLDAESPYRRVIGTAATDLGAIARPAPSDDTPSWAATLLRYAAIASKAQEARALAKQKPEEAKGKYTDVERQAFGYVTAYGEALDQLKGELGGGDKAYRSVQKVVEEAEPTERSTHPVQRALWNLQALRTTIGARQGDDQVVWSLLTRPVELVWRSLLDEAAQHIQGQWEAMIPGLVGLTPGLQAAKIIEFANGPAAILLERSRDRYVLRKFLGQTAPLSPAFVEFISRIRWIPADRLERIDPPRLIVTSS